MKEARDFEENDLPRRLLELIKRRLSDINADVVMRRALQRLGKTALQLTKADLPAFAQAVGISARTLLGNEGAAALVDEVAALSPEAKDTTDRIPIESERDVAKARSAVFMACTLLGADAATVQRAVMIVAELARNIAVHAKRGSIELRSRRGMLVIIAEDQGGGIANVEAVLARPTTTGAGQGIAGVKKLSSKLDIKTGPNGTRVDVELALA